MNKGHYILMIVLLLFAADAMAQGDVVVHTDPRLAGLLKKNRPALQASTVKVSHKPIAAASQVDDAPVAHNIIDAPIRTTASATSSSTSTTPEEDKPLRRWAPVHYGNRVLYSGKGFRVQVYNGPDRAKATDIKAECMHRFPGVRIYLTYISPCFRVKVGDYRSRVAAESVLKEANTINNPCMIVPDLVTICSN